MMLFSKNLMTLLQVNLSSSMNSTLSKSFICVVIIFYVSGLHFLLSLKFTTELVN
uniref:SJCHGC06420 protein n=1 Tax=Schistosoma japonicum TaxID=6182 RepID=Q5BS39_SCHJA|nr:SJCHGC06420 protein [Schistosoma japonicum]